MRKLVIKTAMFFLSLLVSIVSFAQTTSKEWFDKAEKLYADEKYKEAAVAYDKATELDPKNQTAFYKAGWCYNDLDKFINAIDRLKKAVALKKNDHLAWQELGYAYKKTAKNQEALNCINKAIEIKPDYALAYKQLGDVYQNMNKNAEAIAAYKKCYDNDSENDDACYNLGYIYNGLEEYDNALEWLNKANDIKKSADVYNEIGFAYYKLKKNDEAIDAYKSTLKINDRNSTAYKGMGDVYRLNYSPAKLEESIENYLKAIEYNPQSSGSYYGLGWCYNEKSRFEEAIPMLTKSTALEKTFAPGYVELGYAQYMTGKYTEGLSTLKLGLVQDSKNRLCRYYSGLIYVKQADKSNATIMYNELKPLDAKLADKLLAKINAL
jgi:tetratricopeptide (TPR) repeat protein